MISKDLCSPYPTVVIFFPILASNKECLMTTRQWGELSWTDFRDLAMLELKGSSPFEPQFLQVPCLRASPRMEPDRIYNRIDRQNQEIGSVSFHNAIVLYVE